MAGCDSTLQYHGIKNVHYLLHLLATAAGFAFIPPIRYILQNIMPEFFPRKVIK